MELNNLSKRIITATLGVAVIYFGFMYLPEFTFGIFSQKDFKLHPLIFVITIVFLVENLFQIRKNSFSRNKIMFLFIFLYLLFFVHVVLIENMFEKWRIVFFYIFTQVFITDLSGYFVGKYFGKKKINFVRNISPNKTLEGFLGAIIVGFICGVIIIFFLIDTTTFQLATFSKIILILSIISLSILGDLFVSFIKRRIGIKDFSNLLYGHGGISDRLDSVLPSFTISFWIFFLL